MCMSSIKMHIRIGNFEVGISVVGELVKAHVSTPYSMTNLYCCCDIVYAYG